MIHNLRTQSFENIGIAKALETCSMRAQSKWKALERWLELYWSAGLLAGRQLILNTKINKIATYLYQRQNH
jgi:hypothetical protein